MGLFSRINQVIKGSLNDMMDKMTDPAKEVDLLIAEMEEGLDQIKEEILKATTEVKKGQGRERELSKECEIWGDRAEKSVREGDDDLAREALRRKRDVSRDSKQANELVIEREHHLAELKRTLKALEARLAEVKIKKDSLKQRARAAKDGSGGVPGSAAFAEFDRFEAKIEAIEEMNDVAADLSRRDAETEAKFAALEERGSDVDDQLAALKRRIENEG